jgi:hypothetical protein
VISAGVAEVVFHAVAVERVFMGTDEQPLAVAGEAHDRDASLPERVFEITQE